MLMSAPYTLPNLELHSCNHWWRALENQVFGENSSGVCWHHCFKVGLIRKWYFKCTYCISLPYFTSSMILFRYFFQSFLGVTVFCLPPPFRRKKISSFCKSHLFQVMPCNILIQRSAGWLWWNWWPYMNYPRTLEVPKGRGCQNPGN